MVSKKHKLAEAAQIRGIHLEKLKIDNRRGHFPVELIVEGKKTYKVISADILALLLQKKDSGGYAKLKTQWRQEMFSGTHSGTSTPVSAAYMTQLEYGLKKLWAANKCEPSIEGLNTEAVKKTFAQYPFDEVARRDHHSTKMQVYKAVSSFIQFLIKKGLKAPSTFEELTRTQ